MAYASVNSITGSSSSEPNRRRRPRRNRPDRSSSRRPTVGPRALNQARLSPAAKARIQRLAEAAAAREYAPQIEAARDDVATARQAGRQELQSISGATNMVENSIDEAIKNLKSSGLRGKYLHDAVQELTARRADLPTGEQFLKADVRSDVRAGVVEAKTAVRDLKVDREVAAAQNFTSGLTGALTDAESALKRQKAAAQEKAENQREKAEEKGRTPSEKRADREEVQAAAHEVQRLFALNPELATQIKNGTADAKVWAGLEELVRKAEGVGFTAAQKVIERLRARLSEADGPLNQGAANSVSDAAAAFSELR